MRCRRNASSPRPIGRPGRPASIEAPFLLSFRPPERPSVRMGIPCSECRHDGLADRVDILAQRPHDGEARPAQSAGQTMRHAFAPFGRAQPRRLLQHEQHGQLVVRERAGRIGSGVQAQASVSAKQLSQAVTSSGAASWRSPRSYIAGRGLIRPARALDHRRKSATIRSAPSFCIYVLAIVDDSLPRALAACADLNRRTHARSQSPPPWHSNLPENPALPA